MHKLLIEKEGLGYELYVRNLKLYAPWHFLVLHPFRASLVAQIFKNLPAMQETRIWSLGLEDPLEKGMETHFSILSWRIP